jgi:hypothetical protein
MKTRAILALTALAGMATAANAQNPSFTSSSTISVPVSWVNNTTGTQATLMPGDSATIFFNVSFTGQGTVGTFTPPIGTFTSGTILGLGSGFFDLNGAGGTTGAFALGNNPTPQTNNGTTGIGVRSGWRIVGNASPGSVNAAGTGVTQIQFGQFPASPELANTTNPINRIFAMTWTPSSYTNRTVTFSLAGYPGAGQAVASVYMDLDGSVGASAFVTANNLNLGSTNIPVAPAPASLALLGLGGLVAGRRRR